MDSGSGRILGSGEMAERVRGYDWGPTALGPVEGWSREMITMVNLTLASSSPARVMWGTELILIYNDAYRPIPGPRHPWALGKPAREVYGESWPVVGPLLEQAMATGETLFYEGLRMLLPAAEGTREAYLNYSFIPIYEPGSEAGEAGKVAGLFGTLHEVTGEVVALRKLAESEARALRILQSIGDAVIVTDENALITDMNHVAETMTGWMLGEARGVELSTVFRIVDEEKREPVESPAEKVRRLGTIVGLANHTILIRKDGTEVPIDDSGAPIWDEEAKLSGIVLVFRDITERKMAEKVAQRERAKVLEAMRQAPVFFALLEGPEHVFTMVNANYVSLVGGRDVMHLPVREALPEVAAQGYIEVLDKVYEGERFVGYGQPYTPVVDGRAGELRYVDFVYEPLREADGRVAGIIVCGIDVTDRRKSQEAMERLAAIVDSSSDVILSKDLNGIVKSWNAAAERLFGYTGKEMIGESILKLIPEHLYGEEKGILESIRAGRRVQHFDTVRVAKDGRLLEVSVTISPIRDERGEVVGASKIVRDVSERKRMEESLLQAEKIAATGRMAATIAHEINNPLESVTNLLYLLRTKIEDEEGLAYLSTAEEELSRVSHIARQTLGFYREHAAATLASLSDIVRNAVAIYEPRCTGAGINLETSFRSGRKEVVRRGEMTQVISNLIANSIHAMPHGGRLRVTVEDVEEGGSGIVVEIADNGVGIAPHDLPRVFEAFFTTRTMLGTGIGLFVAKQFVEGHGGEISIASSTDAEGHGTTVRIFLPAVTSYAAALAG